MNFVMKNGYLIVYANEDVYALKLDHKTQKPQEIFKMDF